MKMERIETKDSEKGSLLSLAGSVISAIVASICCLGPLVLLTLGVTGTWIGTLTALQPYRPVFVTITLVFLGFAFFGVYRRPKAICCSAEKPCAISGSRRKYKTILWAVMILILGLLLLPYLVPYVFAGNQTERTLQTGQVVLGVKNMTCASCIVTVKRSLTRLNGVQEAKVTLDPPEAAVVFDPVKIKVEDLIKATTNSGYPSWVKQKKEK